MKKLIALGVLALAVAGYWLMSGNPGQPAGGSEFFYKSSDQATSSAGIYSWSTVLTENSGRGYVTFCNNGSSFANDAIYLGFGATSTKPYGYRLASGECYEMTQDKMFYGNVYAISSTATTTLLRVSGSHY